MTTQETVNQLVVQMRVACAAAAQAEYCGMTKIKPVIIHAWPDPEQDDPAWLRKSLIGGPPPGFKWL